MSFQNKNFWIPTDAAGCLTDGDMEYNASSRIEPKRPHQWFMDPSEPELFRNKKQAIDASSSRLVSGFPNMSYPMLGNQSNFQAGPAQYAERMFNSESFRPSNLVDMNISMVGTGGLSMGRKGFEDPYGNSSSVGLSMSGTVQDPSLCLNYGGVRKVRVNQVGDSGNSMHGGQSYNQGANNAISSGIGYRNTGNGISLGPVFNGGESSSLAMGAAYNKMDGNFISMGHSFNKGDGNFMLMGHNYSKGNDDMLSMGQPFDKNGGFVPMGMQQQYEKGNPHNPSISPAYNNPNCNNISGNFIAVGPSYDTGSGNVVSSDSAEKAGKSVVSTVDYDNGSLSGPSMRQNFNNGDGGSISLGGAEDGSETPHAGEMVNGYSLPTSQPSAAKNSEVGAQENSTVRVTAPGTSSAPAKAPRTNAGPKTKEPKTARKAPVNNFPSHVKSLMSTGILDGVPVKYVAWSREKSVTGMIKGTAYLCGCLDCNFNKCLNAYELERHAGCKTKHPNNHIYFENGKTIYAVVQELKMTPQDKLFDAIEKATGSEINQANFRVWKESFQAATRELQRIYGNDAVEAAPSSSSC